MSRVSLGLMGSARNRAQRRGIRRPGPPERGQVDAEEEAGLARRRERDVLRQRRCRERKRATLAAAQRSSSVRDRRKELEPAIAPREVSRVAQAIVTYIQTQLSVLEGPRARESVLLKVMSKKICTDNLLGEVTKKGLATQDVVAGLVQSLSEVKSSNSNVNLAIRHAVLTAVVSAGSSSVSQRELGRLLQVHPRNLAAATKRRLAMDTTEEFAWVLSVRKVRVDIVSNSWKSAAIAWWALETRMSPNRKDVVNHRIGIGIYTKHPTQYLMES